MIKHDLIMKIYWWFIIHLYLYLQVSETKGKNPKLQTVTTPNWFLLLVQTKHQNCLNSKFFIKMIIKSVIIQNKSVLCE